jgi:hypothetical protein
MGIFFHVAALAPFISLFLLVKLTLGGFWKLAEARRRAAVSHRHVCKNFL